MNDPLERLLSALRAHGCDPRQAGRGWAARCPGHDDRRASLSIAEGHNGQALVYCHAGCSVEDILRALGLSMTDLFSTSGNGDAKKGQNGQPGGKVFATAEEAVTALEHQHGRRSALWTYHDARGELVGVVVRWDRPGGTKDIRPVSRHADGWRIAAMPPPRPLYGLPEILRAGSETPVVVVEGEKAADAAAACGLVAVTSAGGAQAAGKTDWGPMAGREVVILPDHDSAGERYAADVARLCRAAGARTVRILRLADHAPYLPPGGDLADILTDERWCGLPLGDAAEPADLASLLQRLAATAPEWAPEPQSEPGPVMTCLADVAPRDVSWLWPGRVPLGRLTLLVGRPGEGKSFLTLDMAARVSTGTPWPDDGVCTQGSVLLLTAEDDPADTIRPRLDALGADVSRVHLLSAVRRIDTEGQYERMITLTDVDAIQAALEKLPDCKLVVVDPIGSFLGGRTDAHRDNEVRSVLGPIAKLAEQYGPAVLVVAHRRKSPGSIADDLALGSRAFTGVARAVWHLTRDPENKMRRLLLPGKNNLAAEGDGLAFFIADDPPRLIWDGAPVAMSANDALAAEARAQQQKHGPDADVLAAAVDWLRSALADGPRLAKELKDEWCNGHGGSKRTLDRAKQFLGVEAFRHDVPGPWYWRLPGGQDCQEQGCQECQPGDLGVLGNLAKTQGKSPVSEPKTANIAKNAKFAEQLGDVANGPETDDLAAANWELLAAAEEEEGWE